MPPLRHTCRKSMMAVFRCQSGHQQLDLFFCSVKMDESFINVMSGEGQGVRYPLQCAFAELMHSTTARKLPGKPASREVV